MKDRTSRQSSSIEDGCAASYSTVTAEVLEAVFVSQTGKLLNISSEQIRDCSSDDSLMNSTGVD